MSRVMTHWSLSIPKELDQKLRKFLAESGRMKKGDLSNFVANAVKDKISFLMLESLKERNSSHDQELIMKIIEEACTEIKYEQNST